MANRNTPIYWIGVIVVVFLMIFANMDMVTQFSYKKLVVISILDVVVVLALVGLFNPKRFSVCLRIFTGFFFLAYFTHFAFQIGTVARGTGSTNDKLWGSVFAMAVYGIPFLIFTLKGRFGYRGNKNIDE